MHDKNILLKTLYYRAKKNEITKEIVKFPYNLLRCFVAHISLDSKKFFFCLFVCMGVCMHNSMRRFYLSKNSSFPAYVKQKIPSASFYLSCFIPNKKCLLPYLHITLQAIGSQISSNKCNLESHKSDGSTVLSLIQLFIRWYHWFVFHGGFQNYIRILPNIE